MKKYSLLFALCCISFSQGVFGCFAGWSNSGASYKGTCTEIGRETSVLPHSKDLEEFKLDLSRLSDPRAQFPTDWARNLGHVPNKHESMKDIYQSSAGGSVQIIKVGTPSHAMFIIGQYPTQVMLFERLFEGGHEYFAVSVKSDPKILLEQGADKANKYIYKSAARFAKFFVSDRPALDLLKTLNEFPVKTTSLGIKTHPISIEYKDIALWRINFGHSINSPLACRHFLELCLQGEQEECGLYYKPKLVGQDLFVPINFPNNKAVIKIRLQVEYNLASLDVKQDISLYSGLVDKPLEDILKNKINKDNCSAIEFCFLSKNHADRYIGAKWNLDIRLPSAPEGANLAQDDSQTIGDIIISMLKYLGQPIDELAPNGGLPTELLNGFHPTSFIYPPNSDV